MMHPRNPWILLAESRQREGRAYWRGFRSACTAMAVSLAAAVAIDWVLL